MTGVDSGKIVEAFWAQEYLVWGMMIILIVIWPTENLTIKTI